MSAFPTDRRHQTTNGRRLTDRIDGDLEFYRRLAENRAAHQAVCEAARFLAAHQQQESALLLLHHAEQIMEAARAQVEAQIKEREGA